MTASSTARYALYYRLKIDRAVMAEQGEEGWQARFD